MPETIARRCNYHMNVLYARQFKDREGDWQWVITEEQHVRDCIIADGAFGPALSGFIHAIGRIKFDDDIERYQQDHHGYIAYGPGNKPMFSFVRESIVS